MIPRKHRWTCGCAFRMVELCSGEISQISLPLKGTVEDLLRLCQSRDPNVKSLSSQSAELSLDKALSLLDPSLTILANSSVTTPQPSAGSLLSAAEESSTSAETTAVTVTPTNSIDGHRMTLGDLLGTVSRECILYHGQQLSVLLERTDRKAVVCRTRQLTSCGLGIGVSPSPELCSSFF